MNEAALYGGPPYLPVAETIVKKPSRPLKPLLFRLPPPSFGWFFINALRAKYKPKTLLILFVWFRFVIFCEF